MSPTSFADRERIVITGSSGVIGTVLARGLWDKYAIVGFDQVPPAGDDERTEEFIQGNVMDASALDEACRGTHVVIHLAAHGDPAGVWDDLHGPNIIGTYNVFAAALRAGVRRVIFASSSHVSGGHVRDGQVARASLPPAPLNLYGVTKAFGELLGYYHAATHELSVICARIGWIQADDDRTNRPDDVTDATAPMFVSHRDLIAAVTRAINTDVKFGTFYVMSSGARTHWDLDGGRRDFGYEPQD